MTTAANTKKTASKYTAAQEQAIRDAAAAGPLNQAAAEALAASFGSPHTTRGVVAKISRMGLPYARKVAVSKTGAPIEKKEDIVAEIAKMVSGNLEGLEKAPKPALQVLRDFLVA